MTERGLPLPDAASACPFVAFEDDRDERSDRPDHRHRCYAELPPAPRAIAHQEAYCLASAFAVCPTFQDWAQREAARTRRESQAKAEAAALAGTADDHGDAIHGAESTARDAADRRAGDEAVLGQPADEWRGGMRPIEQDAGPPPPSPRRNPPRDWAAPPPWAAGAGGLGTAGGLGAAGAAGGLGAAGATGSGSGASARSRAGQDHDPDPPRLLAEPEEGRGLVGSAADRLARETAEPEARHESAPGVPPIQHASPMRHERDTGPRDDEGDEELAGLVRSSRRDRHDRIARDTDEDTSLHRSALAAGSAGRRDRGSRVAAEAPSWEEPRRFEAYPTIKARPSMPGLPRIGIMVVALALAALALFMAPGLFGWFGSEVGGPEASPSPTAAAETASPEPTVAPAPTAQIYIVKAGDTMSKIADRFNVSLDDLLEANADTIKNPDRISIGDRVTIPAPSEDGIGQPEEAP